MDIIIVTGGTVSYGMISKLTDRQASHCDRYIIAADKGLEACFHLGLVPDRIVGDFDSADSDILGMYHDEDKIIRLSAHKDYTDTHVAVDYAISMIKKRMSCSDDRILIYGATGSRIDHMLANIGLLKRTAESHIDAFIVDENNCIRAAWGDTVIERNEEYPFISLIPFFGDVFDVSLSGFEYSGSHISLLQGDSLGISNSITSEKGSIRFKDGMLLIIESRDR